MLVFSYLQRTTHLVNTADHILIAGLPKAATTFIEPSIAATTGLPHIDLCDNVIFPPDGEREDGVDSVTNFRRGQVGSFRDEMPLPLARQLHEHVPPDLPQSRGR